LLRLSVYRKSKTVVIIIQCYPGAAGLLESEDIARMSWYVVCVYADERLMNDASARILGKR
jgi:hypothetical protein